MISDPWLVPAEEVVVKNYELSAKNPSGEGDIEHKLPEQLLEWIIGKEVSIQKIILSMKKEI